MSNKGFATATPDFVTATLPATPIPSSTQTATATLETLISVETPINSSVEGIIATQLNVRAEPSTASETLGIIDQFTAVQVIGKDASGSWLLISYPVSAAGKGWVRSEFVQVNAATEIAIISGMAGSGTGVSGLVTEKLNVRSGPGTDFESLGILNPKDVVFVTGKDPSGQWIQIEFSKAVDGKGWAAVKFLQVENSASVPVIGTAEETSEASPTAEIAVQLALQDGDSMQAPLAETVFSPTGTQILQVNGDLSAPTGDAEDWIKFTPFVTNISVQAICTSENFHVELQRNGQIAEDIVFTCGQKLFIKTTPGQPHYLRLQAISNTVPQYIQYTLKISILE